MWAGAFQAVVDGREERAVAGGFFALVEPSTLWGRLGFGLGLAVVRGVATETARVLGGNVARLVEELD